MNASEIPVVDLLPHGPEFCLIDRLLESSEEETKAVVEIHDDTPFLTEGGVPAYVGIEYMAQTIAARIGFQARLDGLEPPIGFLLGTRSFRCAVSRFPLGSRLEINVRPSFVDGKFGAFDCRISTDDVLAEAALNTYQPDLDAPGDAAEAER